MRYPVQPHVSHAAALARLHALAAPGLGGPALQQQHALLVAAAPSQQTLLGIQALARAGEAAHLQISALSRTRLRGGTRAQVVQTTFVSTEC